MEIKRLSKIQTKRAIVSSYSINGASTVSQLLELAAKTRDALLGKVEELTLHTENGKLVEENFNYAVKLLGNMEKSDSLGEDSLFIAGKINGNRVVVDFPLTQHRFLSIHTTREKELSELEQTIFAAAKGV